MNRDPTRPELTDAERMLLGYLHRYCRGVDRARTYARLRADLAEVGLVVSERAMYELVRTLVLKGRPVGTRSRKHGGGAFIVQTARDARAGYRNLCRRMVAQGKRCQRFRQMAREGLTQQRYLDLERAERAYVQAHKAAGRALVAQADLFVVEGGT